MKLTTLVKLQPSPEEHAALVQTLRMCNATCDRISRIAFEHKTFRKFDLHHLTYHNMRAETELAAGHVVCAIAKVANAYKAGAEVLRTFDRPAGLSSTRTPSPGKSRSRLSVSTVCAVA